jgi:hypothetical protein
VTRLDRVRPAILVSYSGQAKAFTKADDVIPNRMVLESYLLDLRLASCFDAAEKLLALSKDTPPPVPDLGATNFVLFQIRFATTDFTSPCDVKGWLRDKDNNPATAIPLKAPDAISFILAASPRFNDKNAIVLGQGLPTNGAVAWKDFGFLVLHFDSQPDEGGQNHTGLASIDIGGIDEAGVEHPLGHVGPSLFEGDTPDANRYLAIPVSRPPVPPPPPEPRMQLSVDERINLERLYIHLQGNAAYYNRALWLNEDPNVREIRFSSLTVAGVPLLSLIENRALELIGESLAFPVAAGLEQEASRLFEVEFDPVTSDAYIEQLLVMPTRGLFGEAKLGNCNSSEIIDPARFWDWQKSPIQFTPPDITGADAGTRAQPVQGLTPTPFPQSMINIVTPQSLPDPTGLGDALKVLGTPNIFRDQSGQQVLGTLLGKLSDNATSLAAQGLKGAQQSSLLDQIQANPDLTTAQKKDLMGQVLSGSGGPAGTGTTPGKPGSTTPGTTPPATPSGGTPAPAAPGGGTPAATPPPTPPAPAQTTPQPPTTNKPQRPSTPPQRQGLAFQISFLTPMVSTTAEGTADIDIWPVGTPTVTPQEEDQGYVPGVSIGPPAKGQQFQYYNRPFTGGRAIVLQTDNATAPGQIHIAVNYKLITFKRDDVLLLLQTFEDTATTRLNSAQGTFHYDNSVSYKQPTQGNIVLLEVIPHLYTVTITAESGTEASQAFSSKVGGNAEILSVEGSVSQTDGTTKKQTGAWTISFVTGGLDITQKN